MKKLKNIKKKVQNESKQRISRLKTLSLFQSYIYYQIRDKTKNGEEKMSEKKRGRGKKRETRGGRSVGNDRSLD